MAEAPDIGTAQYDSCYGPCLGAFHHQQVYRIGATATDRRWPAFVRYAAAHPPVSSPWGEPRRPEPVLPPVPV
jgi:hypothetical protein